MKLDIFKLGVLLSGLMHTTKGFATPAPTALNQIQSKNTGNRSFTLNAIDPVTPQNEELNPEDFPRGYIPDKKAQQLGVKRFVLTTKQVLTHNFGFHTLNAIRILMENKRALTTHEAFDMVSELNEDGARGVAQFELEKDQVKGLNIDQIRGMSYFNLTREQVKNPSYNKEILETMLTLRIYIPNAEGAHLYKTAMGMEYYQIRGLLKHGLPLDQIGMGTSEGFFIQKPLGNSPLKELIKDVQSTLLGHKFDELTKEQEDKALGLLDKILQDIKGGKISLKKTRSISKLSSLGEAPNKTDRKNPPKRRRNKGYKNNPKKKDQKKPKL